MSVISNLWSKVKSLVTKMVPKAKTALDYGVEVAAKLSTALENPMVDVLTAIVPGTLDDAIVAKIRAKLPVLLINLNLVKKAVDTKNPDAVIKAAMAELSLKEGSVKAAMLHSIAGLVSEVAADGELTWSEVISVMEEFYQETKTK